MKKIKNVCIEAIAWLVLGLIIMAILKYLIYG